MTKSNNLRERIRSYLKELTSSKVDYVDQRDRSAAVVAMQNLPLVYGESMLSSHKWITCRPSLESGWHAENEFHSRDQVEAAHVRIGDVDESMVET